MVPPISRSPKYLLYLVNVPLFQARFLCNSPGKLMWGKIEGRGGWCFRRELCTLLPCWARSSVGSMPSMKKSRWGLDCVSAVRIFGLACPRLCSPSPTWKKLDLMPVPVSQYSRGSEVQSDPRLLNEFEGHKWKTRPCVNTNNSPFHSFLFPAELNGLVITVLIFFV